MKIIYSALIGLTLAALPPTYKQEMPEHGLDLLDYSTFFNNYEASGTAVMLANSVKLVPKT